VTPYGGRDRESFRVGVNYWPARTAMRWWTDFDAVEVADDLARIAGAGFDSIRIFLTWEDFQPTPDTVSTGMLDKLITVADLAADVRMGLMPTLFTGHMSGVNWIPDWALGSSASRPRFRVVSAGQVSRRDLRSWFDDPGIAAAQARLARRSTEALAGHPAVWAWDLGNENSNCVIPTGRAAGRSWLDLVTAAIRDADPSVAITIGLHMEDLEEDRNLGPAEAATVCDFLTMHGYPIYASWAAGRTDEHLLGFLTEVTRWLGNEADVMFSEFGLPTAIEGSSSRGDDESMFVDEQVAADYTDRALRDLRLAGATGAMLWCANDYIPAIWDDPPLDEAPHERSFGLWRTDGSPKPSVAAAASHRGLEVLPAPIDRPWIDIEPQEFYAGHRSHLPRLYKRYRAGLALTLSDD
jgi:endo-1,4-beta-mannosidase